MSTEPEPMPMVTVERPASPVPLNCIRRGGGEPLLLLHSLGGSLVQWNPVLDSLAEQREVIAVDMPGFGASPELPPGVEPTAQNLAAAVLAFVESLELDSEPAVAGISLGGWVAIECARQGGVSSVVGLCPAGFWREPLPPRRRNISISLAKILRPLLPLMRFGWMRRFALSRNIHHPERVPPADAAAMVRAYAGSPGYPAASARMRAGTVGDLSDVNVPVTLAWAEFDSLVRRAPLKPGILPDDVKQIALPGCGHVPTWDDPELVARVILGGVRPPHLEAKGEARSD